MNQDTYGIDGHKLYWHLDRVACWQKNRLVAPIYVEISPVSYCNHKCLFCGLDFAHIERILLNADILMPRIEEMGHLGVKSIMFAGEGEPLLHPRIADIAAYTKSCGIDVAITTNGMSGNTSLWEKILPSTTWIRFSIDAATPKTYSAVHGISPGSFERTIASLNDAIRVKREQNLTVTIGVQFLMIQQNLADVEAALSLYSDIGIDYLSFKPYSEHPQMFNKTGFTYSKEMVDTIAAKVDSFSSSSPTKIIFRKVATSVYSEGTKNFNHCRALPFWGYISTKGDFYTCSVYLNDDRFRVGNICCDSMAAIFFGDKRSKSINFAEHYLQIEHECRLNCRMARINEFLELLNIEPNHINFI